MAFFHRKLDLVFLNVGQPLSNLPWQNESMNVIKNKLVSEERRLPTAVCNGHFRFFQHLGNTPAGAVIPKFWLGAGTGDKLDVADGNRLCLNTGRSATSIPPDQVRESLGGPLSSSRAPGCWLLSP